MGGVLMLKNKVLFGRTIKLFLAMTFLLLSLSVFIIDVGHENVMKPSGTKTVTSYAINRIVNVVVRDDNRENILSAIDRYQNNEVFIGFEWGDNSFNSKAFNKFAWFMYFIGVLSYIIAHILRVFLAYIHEQDGKKDNYLIINYFG